MRQRSLLAVTGDTAAIVLIVLLWCRAVGSLIVLSLTAEKTFVAIGDDEVTSAAASLTSQVFFVLVVALCAAIVLFRINDVPRPGLWRIAVVLAPWLWMLTRDAYAGTASADSLLYVFVVLALAALRPSPRVLIALGVLVAATALLALAFGWFLPEAGILRESTGETRISDKATMPELGLLQGMFTSENNLAQYLTLGLPAVALLPRWWLRLPAFGALVFAVYWSSSRGAMTAAGATLAVGALVWTVRELSSRRIAALVARVCAGAAVAVLVSLPLLGWDDAAFTERGGIWNGSLSEWMQRSPLFGFGAGWYREIAGTETSPLNAAAYHGHNQLVQWLATGGIVLAVLAVGALTALAWDITRPDSRYLVIAAMSITAIAVSGFLEVPLGYVDRSMFWTVWLVPLVVLFFARPRERRIASAAPRLPARASGIHP
jgi:O-antigen ligase